MAKIGKKLTLKAKDLVPAAQLLPGMVVRVHQRIKELNAKGEEKERTQVFEGTVLRTRSLGSKNGSFTVRKVTEGIGVERIYPTSLPTIEKIEYVKQFATRRADFSFVEKYKKNLKVIA